MKTAPAPPTSHRSPRSGCLALLLGLAPVLAPAAAFAQADDAGTYRAAGELNIRDAPSIGGAVIGVIPPSGRVEVSSCDAFGWCRIRFGTIDGFAARQLLVRTGDLPADAFTLRFGPRAATTATATEGVQEIVGRVTPGTPCTTLATEDGRTVALLGNVPFPTGTVVVLGEEIRTGACGTGTALAVLHVRVDR